MTLNTGGGTFYDAVGATLSGTISGIGGLTKVGDAGMTLSGFNNYTGGTTITGGGIAVTNDSAVGSGTVTLNGGAFIAGANGLNITNAFAINTAGGQVATNGFSLTLSGLIADGNGAGTLNKTGPGTLILNGSNTYSGGTTVDGGTLQVTTNNSVGNGQITLNGGTLQAGANNLNISNAFAIGAAGGGFDTNGNKLTVSSTIVDGIGSGSLAKFGAGTLVLSGANSYSGGTGIGAGTLQVTNNSSLGTGRVFFGGGTFQAGANNLTFSNPFFVDAIFGSGIVDTNGYTLSLSGGISEGIGGSGLTKIGLGTLALSGSNTYTGPTTVNGGTLLGATSNTFAPGAMTVNAAGTVDLGGFAHSIFNVSLNGGTIQNGALSGFIDSIGGTIKDIGGPAFVSATNGTTTLFGNNTYTGATNVGQFPFTTSAVLLAGAANTFSAASTTTIGARGTLDLGGFAQTINTVFLENGGVIQNGTLAGTIASFGGTIKDIGGQASVSANDGTTTLLGNNTYAGATNIGQFPFTAGAVLLAGAANTLVGSKHDNDRLTRHA